MIPNRSDSQCPAKRLLWSTDPHWIDLNDLCQKSMSYSRTKQTLMIWQRTVCHNSKQNSLSWFRTKQICMIRHWKAYRQCHPTQSEKNSLTWSDTEQSLMIRNRTVSHDPWTLTRLFWSGTKESIMILNKRDSLQLEQNRFKCSVTEQTMMWSERLSLWRNDTGGIFSLKKAK